MKWKDLSLKERKQIYDSVRANNPDATYFDIKEQFDSIPTYEDGKGKTINKADLPPEYRTGTPEYFERQRKISGAVNAVQPEAYITPAGYIKDAVNFIEDLGKGDYAGAAIHAALNLIPWGVGKTIKKIKKKVGRAIEGTDAYTAESYAEPFTPTITKKKKGKKVKTEADYDQEFAEVKRKYNNMQEYDKHLADALVNKVHSADATNNYMEYLLDRDNIMSYNEIRQSLMDVNPSTYRYLTTPSENKAHMIQLKRDMQKEGLINNWTDPITQDKIEEYLSYRSKYANRVNPVLRTLYDIRPDKQGFINRMNNLTPIEWAVPLGLPVFFGEEQENK